jgi:hypothetical protein
MEKHFGIDRPFCGAEGEVVQPDQPATCSECQKMYSEADRKVQKILMLEERKSQLLNECRKHSDDDNTVRYEVIENILKDIKKYYPSNPEETYLMSAISGKIEYAEEVI